jgi:hypothetical protein
MPTYTRNNVNYSYTVGSPNATVTSSPNASGMITILASFTIDSVTYNVTSIDNNSFFACSGLTSINIPNSVKSIGIYAFYDCSSLTRITLPNDITSIDNNVFFGCSSLLSIIIPSGVIRIGTSAFLGCSSLTTFTIPNTVKTIGNFAFYNCSNIIIITIPNTVKTIGDFVFFGCSGLTSVTLPPVFTSVGTTPFAGCYNITTINNDPITVSWHSISISQQNNSTPFFNGVFSTFDIANTTIINSFYNLANITRNIISHTSDDFSADFVLLNGTQFTDNGTTITSIPALDDMYGAQEWQFSNNNTLSYKNFSNEWRLVPTTFIFTINSIQAPDITINLKHPAPVITNVSYISGSINIFFTQRTNAASQINGYLVTTDNGQTYTQISNTVSPIRIPSSLTNKNISISIIASDDLTSGNKISEKSIRWSFIQRVASGIPKLLNNL